MKFLLKLKFGSSILCFEFRLQEELAIFAEKTMRTSLRFFIGLAAVLPVLSSCQGLFSDGQGTIRISFLDNSPVFTRASEKIPDTDDFLLKITDSGGKVVYEGRFGDSPEELTVTPGSYTISAASSRFDKPEYGKPVFGDEQAVVVPAGETVSVLLKCRQTNCGMRLLVDESFVELFPSSSLYMEGPGGTLEHRYGETRTAFFRPGTISVSVGEQGGIRQPLFSRTLGEQQILSMSISASVESESGSISLTVDTTRVRFSENFLYGSTDAGSPENAMTIVEARGHAGEEDVWVQGYIVGVATGTGKISFDPPFDKETNIVLGLRSSTTDKDYCMAVELRSGSIREDLNLVSNPGLLGRRIYIKGDLVSAYYGIPGLKGASEYQLK